MGLRHPHITKVINGKRYALHKDYPYGKHEAREVADRLRKEGYRSVRVIWRQQGWFVYRYPQYLD